MGQSGLAKRRAALTADAFHPVYLPCISTAHPLVPPFPQPTFEVLAVAANSGLAAYPTGYTRVWSGAGGAIWRPLPPPGYIAAGDLFSTDPDREPELSAMVCLHGGCTAAARPACFVVLLRCPGACTLFSAASLLCPPDTKRKKQASHLTPSGWPMRNLPTIFQAADTNTHLHFVALLSAEGTVVECSPGERLSLPPQLPHTPAASALVAAAVPRVDLWCNDNSLGTFYAGTASLPFPEQSFDLRSPLGVTPAALLAIGAAEEVAWAAPKQQLAEAAAAAGASPAEASRPQDVQQPAAQQAQQQQPGKVASLRKQKDAGEMFRRFESSRRHLQTESAARLVTPSGAGLGAGLPHALLHHMVISHVLIAWLKHVPFRPSVVGCFPPAAATCVAYLYGHSPLQVWTSAASGLGQLQSTCHTVATVSPIHCSHSCGLPPHLGLGRQWRWQRPRHLHLAPPATSRLCDTGRLPGAGVGPARFSLRGAGHR